MKKIVLSVIVALIAITANAQVYVGGTFGVGSDKVETEGTEVKNTTFKILPEVGYELNMGHRTKRILRIERKEYQTY